MVSTAGRGPGPNGAVRPQTYHSTDLVGWYADRPRPGAAGVAVLTGRFGSGRQWRWQRYGHRFRHGP
ncbi:sortase family protein [Streptomyces celluloflavus]|uniref:hypothetical protein n=1 Tax=Streptomyces celluloflavus TaxID=58344 RepID=UPI00345FB825|nr:hypothetical protein OG717_13225 [Streptomyces celluloflavus]